MPTPRVVRKPFAVGDQVWIPVAEINKTQPDWSPAHAGSVASGEIVGRVEADEDKPGVPRTWYVNIAGLPDAVQISSRRMRRHAKILVFRIGDWDTEQQTLNPLASSLKAQLSLLVPMNEVDVEYIRTLDEFGDALAVHGGGGREITAREDSPWGYAVLVGHGRAGQSPGIRFGTDWKSPTEIAEAIRGLGPGRRAFGDAIFVSLCCETGEEAFGRSFSEALHTTFVGPGDTVHSFEAAGVVHRLFYEVFLGGVTFGEAFNATRGATASFETQFRSWLNGQEKTQ